MSWFSTIFQKHRRFLNFGFAILLLSLITFSGETFRPFLGNITLSIFIYPFSELRGYVGNLQSTAEENRNLKNTLTELTMRLEALTEAREENQRLREFLGFDSPENFKVVPVKIVSLGPNQFPTAAVINKGANDSITVDMPVVNRFGLVGKVKDVMAGFSTVQLLTDPSSAVSGRIVDNRQIGIIRYLPSEGMIFDNSPADAEINKGDKVISSGLGGVYPSGLSVGVVDSVLAVRGEIKKRVWLKPNVDFLKIEELYVLKSIIQ